MRSIIGNTKTLMHPGKTRGFLMTPVLLVGDQVIIRWGKQQGQKAIILKSLLTDGYKVKIEDGSIRYFSAKGLEKQKKPDQASV
jgi:ribosomal protein L24